MSSFSYLLNKVPVNPCLEPPPQQWWVDSFEYYHAFPLVGEKTYGPFYRTGDEEFNPEIGIPEDPGSEKQCFFGLTRPTSADEARKLYHLPEENPCSHVHEFYVHIPCGITDALLFIGPVRGGQTLQVGINRRVQELIKSEVKDMKVHEIK